tara:strand:- start:2470 stop:2706 length:237 start_codon:yes stop_codon:yes gene_type:complete
MELESWMFVGVSVALSVLGFFLKREARKSEEADSRIGNLEMLIAKNDVRDCERWKVANKLLEDRRADIQKLFDLVNKK